VIDIRVWRILLAVCLAGVLGLSLLPPSAPPMPDFGWDKLNHAVAFFVLGVLALKSFPGSGWLVVLGLVAFGVLVEVLQGLSGYRVAEWGDLLADFVGIVAAVGLGLVWSRGVGWKGAV
jgi:VanZ family protein